MDRVTNDVESLRSSLVNRPARETTTAGVFHGRRMRCTATIRLSNAEVNPLTALALDLQSGESPFLFHCSYVYPFDRDKFDSALSRRRYHRNRSEKYVWGITQKEERVPYRNSGPRSGGRLFARRIKQHNWIMKRQSRASWNWLAEKRNEGIEKGRNGSIDTPVQTGGEQTAKYYRGQKLRCVSTFPSCYEPSYFWKNSKTSEHWKSRRARLFSRIIMEWSDPIIRDISKFCQVFCCRKEG